MSVEENKAKTKKFYEEVINQGKHNLIDEYVVEDAIENEEINSSGRESLKQFYTDFRAAFPDFKFTIEDIIAEDDKVVVRMNLSGTNDGTGDFMGFAPSGNSIDIEAIDIIRFEDGMMVEHWGKADYLGMIEQLGGSPTTDTISNIRSNP